MRILLTLTFVFSIGVFADHHEESKNKYEPEVNKAEYYVGTFNKGKDMDDLVDWYEDMAEWMEEKGDTYKNMTTAILQPYFHSDMSAQDIVWVNTWPNPSEQFAGLEEWITGGGGDLLKSLPVTNSRQIDTWQWTVSSPRSMEAGNMMYATYADCSLDEGYDMNKVYDLYKDFAIYAQSQGDTVGRKLIVPEAGLKFDDGVDFIRLMYSSSISERGSNADLFYSKINGSEASKNLKGFSCNNARSYFGSSMKAAG